jgi:hypothetical protein
VEKLVDNFRGVAAIKHGKGDTFLFSYVRDQNVSAASVFAHEDITTIFQLSLSSVAFSELGQLQHLMHNNPLSGQEDIWTYC